MASWSSPKFLARGPLSLHHISFDDKTLFSISLIWDQDMQYCTHLEHFSGLVSISQVLKIHCSSLLLQDILAWYQLWSPSIHQYDCSYSSFVKIPFHSHPEISHVFFHLTTVRWMLSVLHTWENALCTVEVLGYQNALWWLLHYPQNPVLSFSFTFIFLFNIHSFFVFLPRTQQCWTILIQTYKW